jgi:endonuclease/exonuclease/phosphatase family metal-dependent hydrolase
MSMRFRKVVAGLGAGSAVVAGCLTSVVASSPAHAATTANDLRVGSFNISGVNNDKNANSKRKVWGKRRPVVAKQILARKLDVVGIQEANPSSIYKSHLHYGRTQYADLKGALNHRGGHYKVTDSSAYDCKHSASTYKCVYKNQNSGGDNRILYNKNRIHMVSHGALRYSQHASGKSNRYLAWAVLQVRSTGKKFLFTNTHLDPYSVSARQAQWRQMMGKIHSLKGSLPVIAVGDFNTSKFDSYAKAYMTAMKNNGYSDVISQTAGTSALTHRRAQHLRRAWIGSFNGFRRSVKSYSYSKDRNRIGNGVDWIFATNSLTVKKWEVVTRLNVRTLKIKGVIPSDHNLVRATVVL